MIEIERTTPLTSVQEATVLALVEARRLDVVPADVARATSFLVQAEERLNQLPLLTSVVVKYGIAYDACHDVGEALLAAHGFRTPMGLPSTRRRRWVPRPPRRRSRSLGRCSTRQQPEGSDGDPSGPQTVRKESGSDRR